MAHHQLLHNLVQKLSHETLPKKIRIQVINAQGKKMMIICSQFTRRIFCHIFPAYQAFQSGEKFQARFCIKFKRFFDDAVIHQKRKSCPSGGPRQRPADMHFTFIGAALIHWEKSETTPKYMPCEVCPGRSVLFWQISSCILI